MISVHDFFFQSYVCNGGIFDVEGISGFIFRMKPCVACHEPPTTPLMPLHTENTLSFFSLLLPALRNPRTADVLSAKLQAGKAAQVDGPFIFFTCQPKYHKVHP